MAPSSVTLVSLPTSVMCLVAGMLEDMIDKACLMATCRTMRRACVENGREWWSGTRLHVDILPHNRFAVVEWAAAHLDRNVRGFSKSLRIDCGARGHERHHELPSMSYIVSTFFAPSILSLTFFSPYFRLEAFKTVTHLFLDIVDPTTVVHLNGAMLPPRLKLLSIHSHTRDTECSLRLPPCVEALALMHVTVSDVATIASFKNLKCLMLHGECAFHNEAYETMREAWKSSGIRYIHVSHEPTDTDEAYVDSTVPFECYPKGLQFLTLVVKTAESCVVTMRDFTKAVLESLDVLEINLAGPIHFGHSMYLSRTTFTLDKVLYPNLSVRFIQGSSEDSVLLPSKQEIQPFFRL